MHDVNPQKWSEIVLYFFNIPVVLFVHQVITGPEGHQVGVVGRRRDGDGARAAHVGVTQLVGEDLQLVRREVVVVPEHVVVRWPAGALQWGSGRGRGSDQWVNQPTNQQLPGGRGRATTCTLPHLDAGVTAQVEVEL